MPYRITAHDCLAGEFRRIAGEQIDRALDELEDDTIDRDETVHQVRKRCKKIRGLIRLIRPKFEDLYQRENSFFRDAARLLSDDRDRKTKIETYDRLVEHFTDQINREAFGSIRRRLTLQLQELTGKSNGINQRLAEFSRRLKVGRQRVHDWQLNSLSHVHVAKGLKKTFSRGRKAMAAAYHQPSPENFHEWRKRTKYHWYHTRLIESLWPAVFQAHQQVLHELSDHLGNDHDLAVLRDAIEQSPDEFGTAADVAAFLALADQRRHQLQAAAKPLGELLFADKPKQLARRFKKLWRVWLTV